MNKDLKQINNFKGREKIQQYSNEFPLPRERCGKAAFTLAEVLITLGIIGVVAAMTLPVLIQKHQKKVTVTKLKKAYTTIANAFNMAAAEHGNIDGILPIGAKVVAEDVKSFFNDYLFKYLSNPTMLSASYYPSQCSGGSGYQIYYLHKNDCLPQSVVTNYSLGRILFSTTSGDEVAYYIIVMAYDNSNSNPIAQYAQNYTLLIDINGNKKPNQFGKDVFRFRIYPATNSIRPYSNGSDCKIDSIGFSCAAKIINDGWEIKDDYPW